MDATRREGERRRGGGGAYGSGSATTASTTASSETRDDGCVVRRSPSCSSGSADDDNGTASPREAAGASANDEGAGARRGGRGGASDSAEPAPSKLLAAVGLLLAALTRETGPGIPSPTGAPFPAMLIVRPVEAKVKSSTATTVEAEMLKGTPSVSERIRTADEEDDVSEPRRKKPGDGFLPAL